VSPSAVVVARTRQAAWLALAVLLAVQFADVLAEGLPGVIAAVKVLPLLLFAPGMLRDNLRSYIWLCFVCLLYFTVLVVRVFADPADLRGVIGLGAVVVLFIAAMLYVRWRARALRTQSP
jgi:uncharacterized membrane protein